MTAIHMAFLAAGAASVLTWLYLLFLNGDFWREPQRCSTWNNCGKRPAGHTAEESLQAPVQEWESVVAIIPARNEAAIIGRAVTSLLNQNYAGALHVIVVDDQSDDGTAEVARVAQAHICQNRADVGRRQVTVITGKPLPAGWTGKVWAMQQGVEAAHRFTPTYFLFTDADVVHAPDGLATLVTIARTGGFDLASFMVRLHCECVAERLLIPAFVFFFFMLYPPRRIADPKKSTAGAAGGCMLVRREALERTSGLSVIRGEVIDDCALARVIKFHGESGVDRCTQGIVWLGLTDRTESVRAYGGFGEIGGMIARTAFNQLHHSAAMLAGAIVAMAFTFVAPMALIFVCPTLANPARVGHPSIFLGATAWLLMIIAYAPMARFYRLNPLWAATLPIAGCFYAGATVWSAVKFWSGRGGEWKGRVQDV